MEKRKLEQTERLSLFFPRCASLPFHLDLTGLTASLFLNRVSLTVTLEHKLVAIDNLLKLKATTTGSGWENVVDLAYTRPFFSLHTTNRCCCSCSMLLLVTRVLVVSSKLYAGEGRVAEHNILEGLAWVVVEEVYGRKTIRFYNLGEFYGQMILFLLRF